MWNPALLISSFHACPGFKIQDKPFWQRRYLIYRPQYAEEDLPHRLQDVYVEVPSQVSEYLERQAWCPEEGPERPSHLRPHKAIDHDPGPKGERSDPCSPSLFYVAHPLPEKSEAGEAGKGEDSHI